MFIHFNSVAGVLLKCWCAAYINPLRQGRDRLGRGSHSTSCISLSIIYHHLFDGLCLFTSLVPIHLRPASHPLSQLPSCTSANVLLTVTPTFDLQCVCTYTVYIYIYIYIYICQRVPMLSLCLSGAIYQDEVSLCQSVRLFLSACLSQETRPSSWTAL